MVWLALRGVITESKEFSAYLHYTEPAELRCPGWNPLILRSSCHPLWHPGSLMVSPQLAPSLNFHTWMNRTYGNVRTTGTIFSEPELHFLWNPKGNDRPHNSVPWKAMEIPAQCNKVATKMSRVLRLKKHLPCYLQISSFPRQIHSFHFSAIVRNRVWL